MCRKQIECPVPVANGMSGSQAPVPKPDGVAPDGGGDIGDSSPARDPAARRGRQSRPANHGSSGATTRWRTDSRGGGAAKRVAPPPPFPPSAPPAARSHRSRPASGRGGTPPSFRPRTRGPGPWPGRSGTGVARAPGVRIRGGPAAPESVRPLSSRARTPSIRMRTAYPPGRQLERHLMDFGFIWIPVATFGLVGLPKLPAHSLGVRARRRLPARQAHPRQGARADLPGPLRDRAHAQDGPQDHRARHRAAGHDHEGQRELHGQRGGLLPGGGPVEGGRRGGGLLLRHEPDRPDHPAQRGRAVRAGRAARRAGADQRDRAADHRHGDRSVGDRGDGRRDQGHRPAEGDEARDGQAGGGRARAGAAR